MVTWKIENVPPEHLGLRKDISRQNIENVSGLLLRKELTRFEVQFRWNVKVLEQQLSHLPSFKLTKISDLTIQL